MHKTMEICEKLECLETQLLDEVKAQFAMGLPCVNTEEAGKVIDMIKDLASAKKNAWKACYYKTVTAAMEEYDGIERHYADGVPYDDRMADADDWDPKRHYDHWRYSSGRYAPKGHGHYVKSYVPEMDPMMDKLRGDEHRWSTHLDKYRDAKRHYTETHNKEDKQKMDEHAKHHMDEVESSVKEMWDTADPTLRAEIKKDLLSLINTME